MLKESLGCAERRLGPERPSSRPQRAAAGLRSVAPAAGRHYRADLLAHRHVGSGIEVVQRINFQCDASISPPCSGVSERLLQDKVTLDLLSCLFPSQSSTSPDPPPPPTPPPPLLPAHSSHVSAPEIQTVSSWSQHGVPPPDWETCCKF